MKHKKLIKKIGRIALNVLLVLFLAICVFSVLVTLFSRREDGAADVFGYQLRVITSKSMEACDQTDVSKYEIGSIPLNSLVFIETVPDDKEAAEKWYSEIEVGDVLTFRYVYNTQVTITHRVIAKEELTTGGYMIRLVGDNKSDDANQLIQTINTAAEDSPNYIIGKVTGQSYVLGSIVAFLQTPIGIILAIILPCFIIIMMEIFKIFNLFNKDKIKKVKAEQEEKDREIEELRQKLAALEDQNQNGQPPDEKINPEEDK